MPIKPRLWESTQPITRNSAATLFSSMSPIAQIATGVSSYQISIPEDTDREVLLCCDLPDAELFRSWCRL